MPENPNKAQGGSKNRVAVPSGHSATPRMMLFSGLIERDEDQRSCGQGFRR